MTQKFIVNYQLEVIEKDKNLFPILTGMRMD
jgi:hypothetical protein